MIMKLASEKLKTVLDENGDSLLRYASSILSNREAARDPLQETLRQLSQINPN